MKRTDRKSISRLPDALWAQVVEVDRSEFFHDESVPASKWRGYDATGALCWYRHSFQLWHDSFDEEDQPCLRHAGSEILEAWRCMDDSWLRRRIVIAGEGGCNRRIADSGVERVSAREVPCV
jgi:hypothetical protein